MLIPTSPKVDGIFDKDSAEMHDLTAKRPEKVKELSAKWDAWAARANVLPLGAWRASVRQAGK